MVGAYTEEEILNEIKQVGFIDCQCVLHSEEFGSSWVVAENP